MNLLAADSHGHRVAVAAAMLIGFVSVILTWRVIAPKASLDFWFDEMWRLDILRRSDWRAAYAAEATPLPPLWFLTLRLLLSPIHLGPVAVRTLAGILVLLAPVSLATFTALTFRENRIVGVAAVAAGCAASALVMGGRFTAEIFSYVNSYAFESGMIIGTIALAVAADRRRPLPWSLRIALVLLPTATIGGLLLVPGLGLALLHRALFAAEDRPAALKVLAATVGASVVSMIATYFFMYRAPLGRDSTAEYFTGDRFTGRLADVPSAIHALAITPLEANLRAGAAPWVLILTLIGLLVVARRQPVAVAALLPALPLCLLASWLTGFPATANRVNMPLVLFVVLLFAIGAIATSEMALSWLPRRSGMLVGAGGVALLAAWWWTPQIDEPPYRGLRGLRQDMIPIANTPYEKNIVVSYHWMTKWTAHDLLLNGEVNPRATFRFVSEVRDLSVEYIALEQPIYTDLSRAVATAIREPEDAAVWCIIPYDIGPEATEKSCHLDDMRRQRVLVKHGERAEIVLWTPVPQDDRSS